MTDKIHIGDLPKKGVKESKDGLWISGILQNEFGHQPISGKNIPGAEMSEAENPTLRANEHTEYVAIYVPAED